MDRTFLGLKAFPYPPRFVMAEPSRDPAAYEVFILRVLLCSVSYDAQTPSYIRLVMLTMHTKTFCSSSILYTYKRFDRIHHPGLFLPWR